MAPRFKEDSAAGKKLIQLFDRFAVDPNTGVDATVQTPDYIKNHVWPRESEFKEIAIKNFREGYRRFANKWLVNSRVVGQRKRQRGKILV